MPTVEYILLKPNKVFDLVRIFLVLGKEFSPFLNENYNPHNYDHCNDCKHHGIK
jgi:hypothetical protein